jgi:hypothetical protein
MTPFQMKFPNATKDTLFTVVNDESGTFDIGSVVQLCKDDSTSSPAFRLITGYTRYVVCGGEPGAYVYLNDLQEIEVKKPMKLLYDIQSVLGAAKYLEPFTGKEREEIAQKILADIRTYAKKDVSMTGTLGYVILFDRGNEYISAEVCVSPSFGEHFFMEEEL